MAFHKNATGGLLLLNTFITTFLAITLLITYLFIDYTQTPSAIKILYEGSLLSWSMGLFGEENYSFIKSILVLILLTNIAYGWIKLSYIRFIKKKTRIGNTQYEDNIRSFYRKLMFFLFITFSFNIESIIFTLIVALMFFYIFQYFEDFF